MGQPTQDAKLEIVKDSAALKKAADFISQNEGNRPVINDPRRDIKTRSEMTASEYAKQKAATEKALNG